MQQEKNHPFRIITEAETKEVSGGDFTRFITFGINEDGGNEIFPPFYNRPIVDIGF
jgi:hypothetical protein